MLENWLDKKIRKLGYIRQEEAVSPDELKVVLEHLSEVEKRLEKSEEFAQELLKTVSEQVRKHEEVVEKNITDMDKHIADMEEYFGDEYKDFIADQITEHSQQLEKQVAKAKDSMTSDLKEIRSRLEVVEKTPREFKEIQREVKRQGIQLVREINKQNKRLDKMVFDQETSNQTIQEFTQRYNSVVRPKSRFINN